MKSTIVKKTFWILYILFFLILAVLSYKTFSVISLEEDVSIVIDRYTFYDAILTPAAPVFFLILLIISNLAFIRNNINYCIWMTLALYIVFTLINYVYISSLFFHYKKICGVWAGEISVASLQGFILCVIAIFICVINYVIITIMKKKRSMK
jgi:hypothetical protein